MAGRATRANGNVSSVTNEPNPAGVDQMR